MNFIKTHLIENIKKSIKEKQDSINFKGYFYLDDIIKEENYSNNVLLDKKIINKINYNGFSLKANGTFSHYMSFSYLNGNSLFKLYQNIKQNKFYFYKKIENKSYKIRFKNKISE